MNIHPGLGHHYGQAARFSSQPAAGPGPASVARPGRTLPAPAAPGTVSPAVKAPAAGQSLSDRKLAVEAVPRDDFVRFRHQHVAASMETTLELELATREGDRITLDFAQIDTFTRSAFAGRDADGNRVRVLHSGETSQRLVSMSVEGNLSEEELAAVDAALAGIIELANEFFGGSPGGAFDKVQHMDLDAAALLDVSLQMSRSQSLEVSRSYGRGGDTLPELASRDSGLKESLGQLGDAQRSLVAMARRVLDDHSAAKMVRSLLPNLLAEPAQQPVKASA